MLRSMNFRTAEDLWPPVGGGTAAASSDGRIGQVLSALTSGPGRLVRFAAEQCKLRRAADELRNLDDRMLQDIGIARDQIDLVVRFGRSAIDT